MNRRAFLVGAAMSAVSAQPVHAQNFPSRVIRIIVPYPPGQASDVIARLLADRISKSVGQPVIIENRAGAGGNIGTEIGARAEPDGYTLTIATAALPITKLTYKKLNFDPIGDFAPVSLLTTMPLLLATSPKLGIGSVKELIEHAKANPGKLTFASSGIGTSHHLSGELFASLAGVKILHVPYRGSAPAHIDLINGTVDIMFDNIVAVGPQVSQGNLKGLAVTTARRSPSFPALPTMAESGLPDFAASAWFGVLAPKATPGDIVRRLNAEVVQALSEPQITQKLSEMGAEVTPSTPAELGQFMANDLARWRPVVEKAQIALD